jgi:hypothetical protein
MSQFDSRFIVKPRYVDNPGARKRATYVAVQQRAIQGNISQRPSNIHWFEEQLDFDKLPNNRPLVGYFCQGNRI